MREVKILNNFVFRIMVSDRLLCENGKLIFKNKKMFFKENNLERNDFNKKNSLVKYMLRERGVTFQTIYIRSN